MKRTLLFPTNAPSTFPIRNILWLEAKRVYTIIHLKNGVQHICSRNLELVFAELDPELFFRAHRSYVINLQEVKTYYEGRAAAW